VQCARAIGDGFGVGGPALALERELGRLGVECRRFTLADLGIAAGAVGGRWRTLFALWRDILVFSFAGGMLLWWRHGRRRDPGTVVLCHADVLYGDVFVVRSLHKAYLQRSGGIARNCARNPLHALVLLRDAIRFRCGVHRHIVALSEKGAAEVESLYAVARSRISVIPNGVDCERFQPSAAARRAQRSALGIDDEAFVLLFAANEFDRKGLAFVVAALRLLAERGEHPQLLVAGQDSIEPFRSAVAPIRERVHVLGHRPDIERLYAAADALILPTRHDLSPLVAPEALACGLPLLMTDVSGISHFLRDGETGFFVRRNAADIAEKIARLMRSPEERACMGARGRELALAHDWPHIARRYRDLLARVAGERRGGAA